jgi:mannitol-1-phosphate 5-dehydrogenase
MAAAVRDADEMATALPDVGSYGAGGASSVAALIAENLTPEKQRIIYTAENNNYAAEILLDQIRAHAAESRLSRLQVLNTVIGKMSGVIASPQEMVTHGLAPLCPGISRCVLVEEFNRIFISRITLPGFLRGIRVFEEKDELLPFEEAKLYGHNAVHALLGYLAWTRGYVEMSRIRQDEGLLTLGREAFLKESGDTLIRKHAAVGDSLFTREGWRAYADDLLLRMTNPYLHDRVERITRDPRRKLGYGDRLVGAMREALKQGIRPRILALGAAAAVLSTLQRKPGREDVRGFLTALWAGEPPDELRDTCISMIQEAMEGLDLLSISG